MKAPTSTPIFPLLFLVAALATSSVAAAARFTHSFHPRLLPRSRGAFFSPSERKQAQGNLLPLYEKDHGHVMTRFQRQNRFMSPLERSSIARFGSGSRFSNLPSLETKPLHVRKTDPSLPIIPRKLDPWNRRLPARDNLPLECLKIRIWRAYPQKKQKVHPHGHSRKIHQKAPDTNPPPTPPRTNVICDLGLIGMEWSGMELKK